MFVVLFLLIIPLCFNAGREAYLFINAILPKIKKRAFNIIFISVLILMFVLFFLAMAKVRFIPEIIFKIFFFLLGFLFYSVIFINISSLILFIIKKIKKLSTKLRHLRIIITSLFLAIANILMGYGTYNTLDLKTTTYNIVIDSSLTQEENLKIGLISDLHLGYLYDDKRVEEIVDKLNKMDLDLVCIVGDIFDGDYYTVKNKDNIKSLFKSIKTKYGVYASLGNHDAGNSYDEIVKFIQESNIKLLRDEYVQIDNKIILVGRRDSSPIGKSDQKREEIIKISNPLNLPIIVMDHQPGNLKEYDSNVDLLLCGHTHQGQFFPLNIVTDIVYDVDYGYYQAFSNSPQVIVTSGAGSWGPPQRIGTISEVVEIHVKIK